MAGGRIERLILRLLIMAAAIFIVVKILPWIKIDNPATLFVTVLLLSILNTFLRPLLILLTLPINLITLGLFILVINGAILYLVSLIVPGFELTSVWAAILASLLISIISSAINWLVRDN